MIKEILLMNRLRFFTQKNNYNDILLIKNGITTLHILRSCSVTDHTQRPYEGSSQISSPFT